MKVALLIDSRPIHCWTDKTCVPAEEHWSLRVPIIPSSVGEVPLPNAQPQQWIIDTGCTGEGFAWRQHLDEAGIDFDEAKRHPIKIRGAASETEGQPVTKNVVWLCRA